MAHRVSKPTIMDLQSLLLARIMSRAEQGGRDFLPPQLRYYLFSVQLDALHRLAILEEHHLLNDVHLVVDVDGFLESAVIYKIRVPISCD